MKRPVFTYDVLVGIFSNFPEEQRKFAGRRTDMLTFLHGLQEKYSILRIMQFRDRYTHITSRPFEQTFSDFMGSGGVLSTRGWGGDPYEVTQAGIKFYNIYANSLFSKQEVGQLEEIAEKFFEEFGVKKPVTTNST